LHRCRGPHQQESPRGIQDNPAWPGGAFLQQQQHVMVQRRIFTVGIVVQLWHGGLLLWICGMTARLSVVGCGVVPCTRRPDISDNAGWRDHSARNCGRIRLASASLMLGFQLSDDMCMCITQRVLQQMRGGRIVAAGPPPPPRPVKAGPVRRSGLPMRGQGRPPGSSGRALSCCALGGVVAVPRAHHGAPTSQRPNAGPA